MKDFTLSSQAMAIFCLGFPMKLLNMVASP